jgi:hypothetical protein
MHHFRLYLLKSNSVAKYFVSCLRSAEESISNYVFASVYSMFNNGIIYYNKLTYLVIRYYTVLIYGFPLISDHHSSHICRCEELLIETRDKEWNYKFTGNLYKERLKCRLLVDQDFVELDFINKKKQSSLLLTHYKFINDS